MIENLSRPLFLGTLGTQELFLILIVLVILGLWLWSLIHCIMNKRLSDTNRIIGIVLIAILGILGSIVYLFLPRER